MRVQRLMSGLVVVLAASYLVMASALFLFQRRLLYFPDASIPSPAAAGVAEMRPVIMQTADGLALRSWYKEAPPGKPTIIFFHGNAGNIGSRGGKARPYLDAGYGLLLAEYRGYGGNPGKPTEEGLYADGRAALAFLAGEGVKPESTVLYGESLGSGAAVRMAAEMAQRMPAAALVLEAPFTSVTDVAAHHYPYMPVRWLNKDEFDSASRIAGVNCPLFVIHGEDDRTVPVKFGKKLLALARPPKESRWIAGAGHNEIYDFGGAGAVLDFLKRFT